MRYDLHVHTDLSACAARDAFPEPYIAEAILQKQSILGFSDHCWAEGVPGASDWYKPQTYRRLQARRERLRNWLESRPVPLRVLQGAEGEFANFLLGLDEESAQYADYILLPHDHVHMKGFVLPEEQDTPERIACFLLNSMEALCKHPKRGLFLALCHPMLPVCRPFSLQNEVYRHLSDRQLEEVLTAAKEADLWIELNLSTFQKIPREELSSFGYLRFFAAAKRVGNILYWGSDAHDLAHYRSLHALAPTVLALTGLKEEDFSTAEHRMLQA